MFGQWGKCDEVVQPSLETGRCASLSRSSEEKHCSLEVISARLLSRVCPVCERDWDRPHYCTFDRRELGVNHRLNSTASRTDIGGKRKHVDEKKRKEVSYLALHSWRKGVEIVM